MPSTCWATPAPGGPGNDRSRHRRCRPGQRRGDNPGDSGQHCLIGITINPESRVKSAQGAALPHLVQNGWTVFLVKVQNEAGVTAELLATSPTKPLRRFTGNSTSNPEPRKSIGPAQIIQRRLDVAMFRDRPLKRELSGLGLEYRIIVDP